MFRSLIRSEVVVSRGIATLLSTWRNFGGYPEYKEKIMKAKQGRAGRFPFVRRGFRSVFG
jgi:hypothetical protein